MRSPTHTRGGARRRFAAGTASATILLAACGGGSDDAGSAAQAGEALPSVDSGTDDGTDTDTDDAATDTDTDADDAGSDDGATPVAASGAGLVDLIGPDVVADAEVSTNLLPDVVIDDLNNGRKVNFRNLVPQEKPILLWMYAPH